MRVAPLAVAISFLLSGAIIGAALWPTAADRDGDGVGFLGFTNQPIDFCG